MSKEPVLFVLNFKKGVLARAFLNDLPLDLGFVEGPDSMTGGANHWLIPGENTLTMEILRAPLAPPPGAHPSEAESINMMLYTVKDATKSPPVIDVRYRCAFPDMLSSVPEPLRRFPFYFKATFTLGVDIYSPLYLESPPAHFECEGTPELHAAVKAIHDAILARDIDAFLDLSSLRYAEFERAFWGAQDASAAKRKEAARKFFSHPMRVKPLDLRLLHFEPRAGGRVALVSGADGQPAIEAIAEDDPVLRLRANILLTQHEGAWRVIG